MKREKSFMSNDVNPEVPVNNVVFKQLPNIEERKRKQLEADARSVYVNNISFTTTPEVIEAHFKSCGPIKRITLFNDQHHNSMGHAYIEFELPELRERALLLNGTNLNGFQIKVFRKRTNVPLRQRKQPKANQNLIDK